MWLLLFLGVVAYLMGSVAFGVIVMRWFGEKDPRTYGSGNVGATNVLRSGKKKLAVLTLLLDVLKGYLPVVIGLFLGLDFQSAGIIGLMAFLGHLFPCYFGFKGGKGVATGVGVVFALNPFLGLFSVLVFALALVLFRMVSLASVLTALILSLVAYYMYAQAALPLVLMSLGLVMKHRSNMQRLWQGCEPRVGQS